MMYTLTLIDMTLDSKYGVVNVAKTKFLHVKFANKNKFRHGKMLKCCSSDRMGKAKSFMADDVYGRDDVGGSVKLFVFYFIRCNNIILEAANNTSTAILSL